MPKKNTITVQGVEIRLYVEGDNDFISLTDIARKSDSRTGRLIGNWLRTYSTVSFLEAWEQLHNPSFNNLESEVIKNRTGDNAFILSVVEWVTKTKAIGLRAKKGRYGGTYAHRDIAFEFASWLSPTFRLYVAKEFQRLKEEEASRTNKDWNLKRTLSKINYKVHTDAIKENLITPRLIEGGKGGMIYANEADLLNMAVFGVTAKVWKTQNPKLKGNIRDHATHEQLLVLANLETINAQLINIGYTMQERVLLLNDAAIKNMNSILSSSSINQLLK